MSRLDKLALSLSLLAVLVSYIVTETVFERIPHLEDEFAFVWQAEVLAAGRISIPTPDHHRSFLIPFVVDHEGQRFGKYPLGWPAVLGLGVLVGARALVNPLLAGLGVWLTYSLGKHVFGPLVGAIAALLTLTSPFFLVNSGSLLSHPLGLVLSAGFVLAWLKAFGDRASPRRWPLTLLAAVLLAALILARPFTAVAVAFPLAIHGGIIFLYNPSGRQQRLQTRIHLLVFGLVVLALGSLHFVWQYAVTGDPLLNPYTLWWPYDKVGFGPGVGRTEEGHNLRLAWINTRYSLQSGERDLFGWGRYSWILLPFGILAVLRNWKAWLVASIAASLVLFHLAYWVGSALFGPRYYYEGLYSVTLLTAAGIVFLAGWPVFQRKKPPENHPGSHQEDGIVLEGNTSSIESETAAPFYRTRFRNRLERLNAWRASARSSPGYRHLQRARPWLAAALVVGLVGWNFIFYLPNRLNEMHGLYEISRQNHAPFLTGEAQEMTPALIIVHSPRWMHYGALLDLQDPFLTTPFIFVWSRGPMADAAVAESYPDRNVFYYYVEEPYSFYPEPRGAN
jgi:hypothetical protein